jgi:hypothetical protein
LESEEAGARRKVAKELVRLSKRLRQKYLFDSARAEIRRGLAVCSDGQMLTLELERFPEGDWWLDPSAKLAIDGQITTAHARWRHLAGLARRFEERGQPQQSDDIIQLMLRYFPADHVRDVLELVWFEPYAKWVAPGQMGLQVGIHGHPGGHPDSGE